MRHGIVGEHLDKAPFELHRKRDADAPSTKDRQREVTQQTHFRGMKQHVCTAEVVYRKRGADV